MYLLALLFPVYKIRQYKLEACILFMTISFYVFDVLKYVFFKFKLWILSVIILAVTDFVERKK